MGRRPTTYTARNGTAAAALNPARALLSRFLRLALVFALAFGGTWQAQTYLAYGASPADVSALDEETDPGTGDPAPEEGEGNEPTPSYSYIESIEVLKSDRGKFEDNKPLEIDPESDEPVEYEFYARVTYVPDSNNATRTEQVDCWGESTLSALTGGLFADLKWELYVPGEKEDDEEQKVPKEVAEIDGKTGKLTAAPGSSFYVRAYSDQGIYGTGHVATQVRVVVHEYEEEPAPEPEPVVVPVTISYDANGGEGEMPQTESDEEGNATVAECAFDAPKDKKFAGWNTATDGTGTSYAPGDVVNAEALGAGDGENASESEALSLVLFAQWEDAAESSEDKPGSGDARLDISYIPAPLGMNATLSPIIANIGHVTFYYVWEVQREGEDSWEEVYSENPQYLLVPTTAETIGNKYRVTMHADREVNPADGSNILTSDPVTLREAGPDEFLAVLLYSPTREGESALLQLQFPNGQESGTSIEWMESGDYGRTWKTIDEATSANATSYYVPTDSEHMGNWYRAVVRREGHGTKNTCDEGDNREEWECDPDVTCSNVQMLVAISDTDAEDIDNPGGQDDNGNGSGDGGDGNGSGDDTPTGPADPSGQQPTPTDPNNQGDGGTQDPAAQPSPQAGATTPAPSQLVPINSITAPGEINPDSAIGGIDVVADPEVSEQISQEIQAQEAGTPGARWRELSVIPQQEEIQEVLESNPFAPFVLPLTVALLACGMVERLVSYRRQMRPCAASFA